MPQNEHDTEGAHTPAPCRAGIYGESGPGPDDRQLVAAAIRAHAQVIVTSNLRDFPGMYFWSGTSRVGRGMGLCVIRLISNRAVVYAVRQIADSWRNPPGIVDDVLDRLERSEVALSVADLRQG